jgi:hypothetical protein
MDKGSDLYKLLGISPEATTSEIRKAWLILSRRYHPDRARNEDEIRYNTTMMFKINAAYEILSDKTKRRQYDQGTQDCSDDRESEAEVFHEPPRAKPGHLGHPYHGRMTMARFFYDCNGADGVSALHGRSGFDGGYPGGHGTNGQDAGPATPGSRAVDLNIFMKTMLSASGHFKVQVHATRGHGEVMDPTKANQSQVPLKVFQSTDFGAQGGAGGHGGFGGDGGRGASGYRGHDATRYSSGGNGGPGGNGGDGGRGSNGADGGRGGDVNLFINLEDIYLLMRVDACEPLQGVGDRVSGGRGGNPGLHGKGGKGGPGGPGGSSYSWTEVGQQYRNGEYEPCAVPRSNPGGWGGRAGRKGYTHTDELLRGNNGSDGTFQICVESNNGTKVFHRRYDLTFLDSITRHLSDMPGTKTFEFGETVLVSGCRVKNTGFMPTPHQRTMIAFEGAQGVEPTWSDHLFLERNSDLRPGGEKDADEGLLQYFCPFPASKSLGADYDPVHKEGTIRYVAHQLGPENETTDLSLISDFQERYTHFHESPENVHMAFPIENRAGICGLHSLDVHETTVLLLKLHNISNQSFGSDSRSRRALLVQIYHAEHEIPLRKIVVRGDGGRILDVEGRGHRKEVFILPRRSDITIQLTLNLNADDIQPCERAGLQADVYLQKIPTLHRDGTTSTHREKRLVQRRLFVVSRQPKFAEDKDSDVVLVTTEANTAAQISAWESLVSEHLRLRSKIYSLSRYGHIDATQVGEEMSLRESLSGKLVILLNEHYKPQPNVESERKKTRRPSQLINSLFDFDESTRFLVVGGQANAVEHMSPRVTSVNSIEANKMASTMIEQKQNRKSFQNDLLYFVKKERSEGFPKERVAPSCKVIQVKTRTLFRTPKHSRFEKTVTRRSQTLQKWLAKKDKLRHYRVEWQANDEPVPIGEEDGRKGLRHKCWRIGEFRIYVGSPRFQNSMVLLGEETNTNILSTPEAIRSFSTLHSTISAAPFEMKMKCYAQSLHALSKCPSSEDHEEVCTAVRFSLVNDFLWDVSNYYQGRMKVASPMSRSSTIQSLCTNETFSDLIEESLTSDAVSLKEAVTREISMLMAGFWSISESKDLNPWWSPLSAKHRTRRAMREALKPLQQRLCSVIDDEVMNSERVEIEREAKHHIKQDHKKFWLRARGRWREALAEAYSPSSPRQAAHSLSEVRARREAELDIGTSHKIKKFSPECASPGDSLVVRRDLQRRLGQSASIRKTTQCDREFYIQT